MNFETQRRHSFSGFFSGILFGIFLLLFLFLLLFCAQVYRTSIRHLNRTQNLYTMSSYLETKFRQHDDPSLISSGMVDGIPALLFRDTLEGEEYYTAIYLQEHQLKELFYNRDTLVTSDLGTSLGEIETFSFSQENACWKLLLTDKEGASRSLVMHPGSPEIIPGEVTK